MGTGLAAAGMKRLLSSLSRTGHTCLPAPFPGKQVSHRTAPEVVSQAGLGEQRGPAGLRGEPALRLGAGDPALLPGGRAHPRPSRSTRARSSCGAMEVDVN